VRKELLIAKRISAGLAAGLVLFIYAAIPASAKRVNTEDDPSNSVDVLYTNSSGEDYYEELGGLTDDFWAEQPFDAYWHNEGGAKDSKYAKEHGRNNSWVSIDYYYSGYARNKPWPDEPKITSDYGRQVLFGIRLYSDDEWNFTLVEEKTTGNVANVVYQINAHTGDSLTASCWSYFSGTYNNVLSDRRNTNKGFISKNAPEYDPEWTIPPSEYFAFYSNIHTARRDGKWIDDCEEYSWPQEYGDEYVSGLDYTIQADDDVVYVDSLGKVKFINHYTGVEPDCQIIYRYKIVNVDNVNNTVLEDTTAAKDTSGEDEGTDISTDIVEGEDFTPSEDDPDDNPWSDISSITDDIGNPFDELDIDEEELPKAVGTGAAGAAAAAGAIGAAGAAGKGVGKKKTKKKEKKEEKKEDKRSTYKMYVYKDFGDTLKRGDETKYVYARIEETTWDKRVFNNDKLTQQISVSSATDALIVSDGGMTVNGYKAAEVLVPKEGNKTKGTVSFQFRGEGGLYTRNVVFNIVGEKPYIIYPKLSDDGASWLESSQPGEAVFIAGQGGEEKVMFYIKDAVEDPIDISFDGGSDFDVSYEKEEKYKCGYYAVVKNLSQEMEKGNDIIADKVIKTINVEAKFKDGTTVYSEFYVELYPDGLSVVPNTRYFKNDKFQVNTVEEENPKPGEIRLMPSSFDVLVCYADPRTGEAKIFKNPSLSHEDPDDEGKYGNMFKENFLYRMDYTTSGGYSFYPKCSLPEFDEPYATKMKLIYTGKDGTSFDGYLPIEFTGMIPKPPSQVAREEAIKRLQKAIRIFGIGNQDIKEMVRNTSIYSASEIEFTTKWIILTGIRFYQECSKEYTSFANLCDKYVVCASAMVKAGDMAFEYVLKIKFGSAGEIAATFINPMKNMYFEYLGQFYGLGADPESYGTKDFSFWKALLQGATDHLEGMLTGEEKPTGEKLGFVVAAYLMVRYADHYYHGEGSEKGDVYRSILAAIGDLSLMKFKEWVANLAKEWTGPMLAKLQNWFGEMFKKYYGNLAREAAKAAGDKAFENGIRSQIHKGIGYAEYNLAKNAKNVAYKMQYDSMTKFLSEGAENFGKIKTEDVDIALGTVLNYVFGGTSNEGEVETLKASEYIEKQLQSFFVDMLGLKIEGLYETSEDIIGLSSFKIKGTSVIIGFKEYEVEIDIAKNMNAILELVFGYCFSWMEKIYQYCTDDNAKVPDARDIMECNTQILDEVLEIVQNPEPIVYRDK
jgi:hypothetical protein